MSDYIPVIGLEIHVELKTKSKMFCQCEADYFGNKPNTQVCPVCLGMPGALPVPNKKAVEWTILIGKALYCVINKRTKFDRKHYFYPDLPKGYQISQYDEPIASHGWLNINEKKFRVQRVHLEEDTGKLMHVNDDTLVDFNRSGVPLVEIVTEPDFDNTEDVTGFLKGLYTIIKEDLKISDANMEQGSMRLEPNISLRLKTQRKLPGYKVEVKNINSFRFVQKAIEFEIKRQEEILNKGKTPKQETRGFNENKGVTFSQRSKEEAHDYRYFPEPDIPTMVFEQKFIDEIVVPELYFERAKKFSEREPFKLPLELSSRIALNSLASIKYEQTVNDQEVQKYPNYSAGTANLIINKRVDINLPLEEFKKEVIDQLKPKETDKEALVSAINRVIKNNKHAVEEYTEGKTTVIMFLVGQVMKEMKGQTDGQIVKIELEKKLKQ